MKKRCIMLMLLVCAVSLVAANGNKKYQKANIVYIGNSITHAWYLKKSPPAITAELLQNEGFIVEYANCAISGSTTVDFLPKTNTLFPNVLNGAHSLSQGSEDLLVFSIMLGTNDSAIEGPNGAPVSSSQYKENLKKITDELIRKYPDCKIVLNRPLWYSPNTHNGAQYLQEGLDRLQTYFTQIDALVAENPEYIYIGDVNAFDFFKGNYLKYLEPEQGNSGTFYLHPNQEGAQKLAGLWADVMKDYLEEWGCVSKTNRKKVACIGNSITENVSLSAKDKYPAILQNYLGEEYIVKNFGIGMRTMLSKGDYPYSKEDKYKEALDWEPDVVIVKLGTNDAKDYNWVHKNEYQQDYIKFVNSFKQLSNPPQIFLCYPLPVYPNNWLPIDNKIFTDEMIPMINNVAEETETSVIDLRTPFLGKDFMSYDQVHPNYKGANYMAYIIASALRPESNFPAPSENLLYQLASDDLTRYATAITSSETTSIENLFDKKVSTGIDIPFAGTAWVAFSFPEKYKLSGYSMISGRKDTKSAPQSWVLEGSNTGKVWYKIEERKDVDFSANTSQLFNTITDRNSTLPSYKHFRLKFNKTNGGINLQLDEIQLYGVKSEFEPSILNNGGTLVGQHEGFPGELIENLNDMSLTSKFCVVDKGATWIQYNSPVKTKVRSYAITSCFGISTRNPRSWTIEASNDGVTWDLLDSKTDQNFVGYFHAMNFPLDTEYEYSKFRLNIDEILTGNTFEIAEWQLFEHALNNNIEVQDDNKIIYVNDNKIHIQGWDEKFEYTLFSIDGSRVLTGSEIGNCTIEVNKMGVYIVHLNTNKSNLVKKIFIF